jgi:hypothetical protein
MTSANPADPPSDVEQLGPPLAEYRVGAAKIVFFWIVGAGAAVLGLAVLALVVWIAIEVRWQRGKWRALGLLGFAAVFLLSAGLGALRAARRWRGERFLVFDDGLAHIQGGKVEFLRWDAVAVLRRVAFTESKDTLTKGTYQIILEGADGRPIAIDQSVARFPELRDLAEGETLKHLLPRTARALRAGETVPFGELAVSPEGLHHGTTVLPWETLDTVDTAKGTFTVTAVGKKKPVFTLPLDKVPNFHVLLALAEAEPRP